MKLPDYFVMTAAYDDRFCAIHDYNESVDDFTAPAMGKPLGDGWPDGVKLRMDRDTRGKVVPDMIANSLGYTIVSDRFKTLLESQSKAKIEWRRITLLNHKGRVTPEALWLANVLTKVDCVDRTRTEGEPYPAEPNWYFVINRLNLLPKKIDAKLALFRLGEMARLLIVRDDLRAAIEKEGIVGPEFHAMDTDVDLQ